MQECELSIRLQHLKMKITKFTQTSYIEPSKPQHFTLKQET
jgi:hypothetical protein